MIEDSEQVRTRPADPWPYATGSISLPPGPMRSFTIEPDHPLVPIWPLLRGDIRAALDEAQAPWYAIEAYHRRRTLERSDEDDTTILVTANRREEGEWKALHEIVRGVCVAHGQHGLLVELVDGSVECFASEVTHEKCVRMGASIAAKGVDWAAGTAGGYVKLQPPDRKSLCCILICHHVLRPTKPRREDSGPTLSPVLSIPSR